MTAVPLPVHHDRGVPRTLMLTPFATRRVRRARPGRKPADPRRVEMVVLACLAIGAPIFTVALIGWQLAGAWRAVQTAMFAGM